MNLHLCHGNTKGQAYGPAVDCCEEDKDKTLWVGNGEYASQVNYCPFCGYKAKVQTDNFEIKNIGEPEIKD